MKKILLTFSVVAALSLGANAQTFEPYINGGVGLSSDVLSYSGQLGAKSKNSRYALSATSVTQSGDNLWRLGGVGYWKINKGTSVDVFATGQADMTLTNAHTLTLTPGLATVFNFKSQLKPELSIGFPIQENSVFRNRPLGVVAALSLNYTF